MTLFLIYLSKHRIRSGEKQSKRYPACFSECLKQVEADQTEYRQLGMGEEHEK